MKLHGEAASANVEAIPSFKAELLNIVNSNNYSSKQVFNVDESGLFWKRMPSRSYVTNEEEKVSNFKQQKDRITLVFCSNAYGDAKVKPLLVHRARNPRALKNQDKSTLPIAWKSSKNAWVTRTIFTEWFHEMFIPFLEEYTKAENLNCKALLLLDNASCHPQTLYEIDSRVSILFMPPNTTSIAQPLDQGIIAAFKAHYLKRTLRTLVTSTASGEESIPSFWKKYNINHAIQNIDKAWHEVTEKTMNNAWKTLWPECLRKFDDEKLENNESIQESIELFKEIGSEEIAVHDITAHLQSHEEMLRDDELLQLENITYADEYERNEREIREADESSLDHKELLNECIRAADHLKKVISKVEADNNRLNSFNAIIDGAMSYYKQQHDVNK